MATNYSANQYQSAFNSSKLQNWNVPKRYTERPSTHDGFTQSIADHRGHLLPGVPRSQVSPWGTFMGTWDMPPRIPPAKLSLTSRSADAAKRMTEWVEKSERLISACNGLRPTVTGKAPFEVKDSQRASGSPGQNSEHNGEMESPRSSAGSRTASHRSDHCSAEKKEAEEEETREDAMEQPPSTGTHSSRTHAQKERDAAEMC
ncbi:protein Flattop [Gastrophryne carolinensis]